MKEKLHNFTLKHAVRTYGEVAKIMGEPESAIRAQDRRVRDKLRKKLMDDPYIREWVQENVEGPWDD